jgi:hypothetical protein
LNKHSRKFFPLQYTKKNYSVYSIKPHVMFFIEPGSSVGIATDYGLDGPEIEKKIPVGARFFAHVKTGPGAHPASCTMGTRSFPGVKRPGRGADHPPPPSAEVENE